MQGHTTQGVSTKNKTSSQLAEETSTIKICQLLISFLKFYLNNTSDHIKKARARIIHELQLEKL